MTEKKRRVLVVDDEPSILKMVGRQLEVKGFEVLVASDGEEAIAKARTEGPDVIVLDLIMLKHSGLEVCQALRQDERCKQMRIILFTGKGQDMTESRLREWGADAFLSKTRGTDLLIQKIEGLLGPVAG